MLRSAPFTFALFLILFSPIVHAATPACLLGFATVADTEGVDEDKLIDNTFRDLYEKLGAGKVLPETLDRWIVGADP